MNLKAVALLAVLLAASPVLAREANSGGGQDDAAGQTSGGGGVDDGSGSGSGSGSSTTEIRVRLDLVRAPGASDGDAAGYVEIRSRSGRERFQVEAEHLDAGAVVEVFVDDGSGSMVSAGTATADAAGVAQLELDTGDGASLPAGAATVADLAGRAVEVRDAAGGVLLTGKVPAAGDATGNLVSSTKAEDDSTGVRAKVRMKVLARAGRQEFRLEVKGLAAGAEAALWIDDGSGTLVLAGTATANGGGKAKFRLDTRKGDALPLGVSSLRDLSGRAFEVRSAGAVAVSGNLPTL